MKNKRILVTDQVHSLFINQMTKAGFEIDFEPVISRNQVISCIHNYMGLLINSRIKADKELITAGRKLKFIARIGSGLEVMDQDFAKQKDITCINAPEGNCNAVAEHALGMMLNLLNHISLANSQVKKGQWLREENRGQELSSMKIGIIGFGNTGSALAKLLEGFSTKVYAYDKYKTGFGSQFVHECDLDTLFNEVDILSIHLQLTNETLYMIDSAFIQNFKKPIYIINTSRGKILRTKEILDLVDADKVIGVGLDVLENEKLNQLNDDEKLVMKRVSMLPNVLLTPHIAGWTVESKQKIAEVLATKIKQILSI